MAQAASSSTYLDIEVTGDGHFAPLFGMGRAVGAVQRLAAVAFLSTDVEKRLRFR